MRNKARAHPRPMKLMKYFDGQLSEADEALIEAHLGDCAACVDRANDAAGAALLLSSWTAEGHGDTYLRNMISSAITKVLEHKQPSDIQRRLKRWHKHISSRRLGVGVVRCAVDRSGEGVQLRSQYGKTFIQPNRVSFVQAEVRARLSASTVDVGSPLGALEVAIPKGQPPLVMLIPSGRGADPIMPEVDLNNGVLRFSVPARDFFLAVEPSEQH